MKGRLSLLTSLSASQGISRWVTWQWGGERGQGPADPLASLAL